MPLAQTFVRPAYHERMAGHNRYQLPTPQAYQAQAVEIIPDIPEDLLLAEDALVTESDRTRLYTTEDGDPMSGYEYGSRARIGILQNEKAAKRLGVVGVDKLDPFAIDVLRAHQAMGCVVIRSMLTDYSDLLNQANGSQLWLKQEADQAIGSFKIRGAFNKMRLIPADQLKYGVIAASAGNHAQGVAMAAALLGTKATIIMPQSTPAVKIMGVEKYGATVFLIGNTYDEACQAMEQILLQNPRMTPIPAFDDNDIIVGQATVAAELLQQKSDLSHIVVSSGGGGMLAGISRYVKTIRPSVKVCGVEPVNCDAMTRSLAASKRVSLDYVDGFADGLAVKKVGRLTFDLCSEYVGVENMHTVSKQAIMLAMKDLYELGLVTEPAGATALAGARELANVSVGNFAVVRSGRNVDPGKLKECLAA